VNTIRLKVLYRTEEDLSWLCSLLGDKVRTVSRVYESKSGFNRVHIDVEPPTISSAKP